MGQDGRDVRHQLHGAPVLVLEPAQHEGRQEQHRDHAPMAMALGLPDDEPAPSEQQRHDEIEPHAT